MPDDDQLFPDEPGKCNGKLSKGKPGKCRRPAGWGTGHAGHGRCKLHGGKTPSHNKSAQVAIAKQEAAKYGTPIEMGPAESLLAELARTHGWIAFFESQVGDLKVNELGWGQTRRKIGGEDRSATYEAKPSIWYQLLRDERKHLIAVIDSCTKSGVAEHMMRPAEDQGRLVAGVIQRSFASMLEAVLAALTGEFGADSRVQTVVVEAWAENTRPIVKRDLTAVLASNPDAVGVMAS
ncbi:hypothetical protein [Aeromicrobium sp. Root472D3]|uniref:hypothetical protein n=1 Tax=Aeromicrobium sp. Root472D3 TaxID=1736540 RepID=UPI0006FD6203|nr:hypothetical protein [Aeromicrobium sp. Root472D3]KQX76044.1 hypothetical protein ASD10_13190 [Aeromicrobium sp. Root472D3]